MMVQPLLVTNQHYGLDLSFPYLICRKLAFNIVMLISIMIKIDVKKYTVTLL